MDNIENLRTTSVAAAITPLKSKRNHRALQPVCLLDVPGALLRIDLVKALVGIEKSSIYAGIKKGSFPAPVKLGARCTRWKAEDIRAYLDAQ